MVWGDGGEGGAATQRGRNVREAVKTCGKKKYKGLTRVAEPSTV